MAIGKLGVDGSNKTQVTKGAAGLAYYVGTNELFVADGYGNNRVIVHDADPGEFKRMWGANGAKALDKEEHEIQEIPVGARSAPGSGRVLA